MGSLSNAAKMARGEASDDSALAVELADASAASMAHLHGMMPQHAYMGPMSMAYGHPASCVYPYAVVPRSIPASAAHLSSYGDEHHRPLPPSVIPMMPSHHIDSMGHTAATAVFSHTPPPGGMYHVAMPTVFPDGMGSMRPYGRPLPAIYAHPGTYQTPASMPMAGYYHGHEMMHRPHPDGPASAPYSSMFFRSAHSPVPMGMMGPDAGAAPPGMPAPRGGPSAMDTLGAFADEALRMPRTTMSLAAAAAAVESAHSPSPSVVPSAPAPPAAGSAAPRSVPMAFSAEPHRGADAGVDGLRLGGDSESPSGWTSNPSRNE